MSVTINADTFYRRIAKLVDAWNNAESNDDYESLRNVDAVCVLAGEPVEDTGTRKSSAFQTWVLAYEFPSTLLVVTKTDIYFLTSSSKVKILKQLLPEPANSPKLHLLVRSNKDKEKDATVNTMDELLEALKGCNRIASLPKEQHTGKLASDFAAAFSALSPTPDTVDCAPALSALMSVKDEDELNNHRIASRLSSHLLANHFIPRLENIIDKDRKISHEALAAQLEDKLGRADDDNPKGPDMKIWSVVKGITEDDLNFADFIYTPIIQSGGSYDLRTSAESTSDNLTYPGIIIASLGIRYKGYCSNVGRTIMVNGDRGQQTNWKVLVELQGVILTKMKEGSTCRDLYITAQNFLKERQPGLEANLVKSLGFATGIEFRDSAYLINAKNARVMHSDMVFCLSLGLQDLKDSKGRTYSLLLIDTVRVTSEKGICLTEAGKQSSDLFFDLGAEKDEEEDVKPTKKQLPAGSNGKSRSNGKPAGARSPAKGAAAGSKVLRGKTRGDGRDVDESVGKKIEAHQRELFEQLQEKGLEKFQAAGDKDGKDGKQSFKRYASYKGELALPKEVEDLKIHVDRRNRTVLLPVYGYAVPLHINAIKNTSKSDEGDFTYLRINFQTPGQIGGKKEDTPFEDPDKTFIRSVTYRSADGARFDNLHRQITDLKKEVSKLEAEKRDKMDVVDQDLMEVKGKRAPKLPEVFARPQPEGKRMPGELEIHQNGLRFHTPLGQRIQILFNNIKHLLFQPCDHELIVLIHIHLKSPIMIGKRKTKDVQFYREASDVQFDETGNRKRKYRYGDEDEIELEQEERKRRQQLNREFHQFADRIAEASDEPLEVDIPFRELSFEGVPARTNVRLQPTTNCLVHLSDTPFLVVTLDEVELCHLERVQFGLKHFDMVIVFQDFTKPPMHINSIPMSELDSVKEWLNSMDVPISEGPVNLQWGPIMKHINEDPYEFFNEGGWTFLRGEEEEEESDESDSASEFQMSSDAFQEDSPSEEEESEYDNNASADEGSDVSEVSEGDDWDELEMKAEKSDRKKFGNGRQEESDDDRKKKKSSGKAPAKGRR
ncbi:FACT complex subunit SPT16 [Calocera viscosa TUFC12733]|uniref:FACT complex subunit n=1 Tax=Calocera viscosa (strain TUFC12733) TaxID=1330018 RepID=A0A167Q7N5_CALVF|nr:FACT complex subunit SPT16 [Calocera viscosa TUFC12733]